MKFNLRNRPKDEYKADPCDIRSMDDERVMFYEAERIDAWFEGFEKELRQLDKNWLKHPGRVWRSPYANDALIKIKEILGEQ